MDDEKVEGYSIFFLGGEWEKEFVRIRYLKGKKEKKRKSLFIFLFMELAFFGTTISLSKADI